MNISDAFSFDNYERKSTMKKVVKKANVNELKAEIEKKVKKDDQFQLNDLRNDRKKINPRSKEEIDEVLKSIQ